MPSTLKCPRGTFMAMQQLVLLSITVMLRDIVFLGERREQIEEGGRHGEVHASLLRTCYTDKKNLIRHRCTLIVGRDCR